MIRKMNKIEKAFFFTIIVLLFQITRNISTIVYIGVLFLSYAYLYSIYIFGNRSHENLSKINFTPIALLFLLSLIWIPFISLANIEMDEYLIAFPRYFVTFPFILFCFIYKEYSYNLIRKVLLAMCIFMAGASLSIPYQIVFGNISFFVDSSYREGFIRYASLAGSLPALGTLGGFSLAILLFTGELLFTKTKKNILIIIIILGMLMSLSKAAVVNILICFVSYILINGKFSSSKRIINVIGLCALTYGVYFIFRETQFALYIQSLIRYSFSRGSLGIGKDLIDRIWERPNIVIQYHNMGVFDFMFGIGFPSLSGILGLPKLPMAHNNYFDLIFSGGIIHFFSFMFLIIRIPLKVICKKIKGFRINEIDRSYSIVVLLILVNMIIGAASFYQPIGAVFIFFIICSYNNATDRVEKVVSKKQ